VTVRICVAIRESTTAQAAEAAARAAEWADLAEIRADYIRDLELKQLLHAKKIPVIFTLRPVQEGGEYSGPESSRLETIIAAGREGADYVDVEFSAYWAGVLNALPATQVILSHHDFVKTPANLSALFDSMAETKAGILKIATRAERLSDNLEISGLLSRATTRGLNLSALAMGGGGIPSRILGPSWGSWMTYASLPGSEGTADGQTAADELIRTYRIRNIGPGTRVYGVLGRPLAHSLSPRIHNAAFAANGMDAVYLPLEAADFEDFEAFARAIPVHGASVTIPFKEAAHARSSSLAIEADQTGAVNTLIRTPGGWHGENTDVEGFMRPFRRRFHVGRSRAVVLGAGGAARAVVCGLRSQGTTVCIVARNLERARLLAERFQTEYRV